MKTATKGANYFYYVCPEGLIHKDEVEKKYGLIYISERRLTIIKKPSKLNSFIFTEWRMLANKKCTGKWYNVWWQKKIRDKENLK